VLNVLPAKRVPEEAMFTFDLSGAEKLATWSGFTSTACNRPIHRSWMSSQVRRYPFYRRVFLLRFAPNYGINKRLVFRCRTP